MTQTQSDILPGARGRGVHCVFPSLEVVSVESTHPQPRGGEGGGGGGEGASPASHLAPPALQHHVRRLEGEGEPAVGFDLPGEGAGVVVEDVLLHGGVDTRADMSLQSSVDTAGSWKLQSCCHLPDY